MKTLQLILALLPALLGNFKTIRASHIVGADISYRHISGNTYKVYYTLYRECKGTPLQSVDFRVSCQDGSRPVTISPTRTSITDISTVCSKDTLPCSPANTPTASGLEKHVFEIQVNFLDAAFKSIKDNCCRVLFSVSSCCRSGAITNIVPGNMYLESMLDLCVAGSSGNSPAEFGNLPNSSICCNMPFSYNCAPRLNPDGDSLSIELAVPFNDVNSPESYTGNFSGSIPMTPYCPPNPGVINCRPLPGAKPPRGFYFDSTSGDIVFTPLKCDEVGVLVFKISDWKKDSSNRMRLAGYVKRETTWFVKTCPNNNVPSITGSSQYTVCAGEQICFNIVSTDAQALPNQTVADTIALSWDSGIAGARFVIADPNAREKTAQFCWRTKPEDGRAQAYRFTATANDDFCPSPGISSRTYAITVKPRARAKIKYLYGLSGKLIFESLPENIPGYDPAGFTYQFTIRDSSNTGLPLYLDYKRKDSFTFTLAGRYVLEHRINNPPGNCPTVYLDTITITRQHLLMQQELLKAGMAVYPNPSGGVFQLGGPESDYSGYTLKVYAADGKLAGEPVVKRNTVDCSDLPKGAYTFVLEKEGYRYTGSILIQ